MMDNKVKFLDQISNELEKKMSDSFVAYEISHGIDVNYKSFAITISNENDVVCGILKAYTAFAEIYIDDIWVDQPSRGKGYGRKLLQALEEHFQGQGFNNINLVTSAFQAPEFYKKCGYSVEFIRVNKQNQKLTKTFFVKYFNGFIETQGTIDNSIS